ncbi:hypothetical protein KM043_007309 [Ampulex compressa]|nr:hypothetical protein KM043_007309 [Ampulex compressa]
MAGVFAEVARRLFGGDASSHGVPEARRCARARRPGTVAERGDGESELAKSIPEIRRRIAPSGMPMGTGFRTKASDRHSSSRFHSWRQNRRNDVRTDDGGAGGEGEEEREEGARRGTRGAPNGRREELNRAVAKPGSRGPGIDAGFTRANAVSGGTERREEREARDLMGA